MATYTKIESVPKNFSIKNTKSIEQMLMSPPEIGPNMLFAIRDGRLCDAFVVKTLSRPEVREVIEIENDLTQKLNIRCFLYQ